MRKPERVKLRKQMLDLLPRLGDDFRAIDERSMNVKALPGKYGRVSVSFYNARDAKDHPWLPCSFMDWPKEPQFVTNWHGFRHWKQNLHFFNEETADQAMQATYEHLQQLGVDTSALPSLAEPVDLASIGTHNARANKDGISKWYIKVDGRRRKIELQSHKGRLYLVGCLYVGHNKVLEFEESLDSIQQKFGDARSR